MISYTSQLKKKTEKRKLSKTFMDKIRALFSDIGLKKKT